MVINNKGEMTMSKTFTYTKFTGHYYCQYSDEWEQDGIEFQYEVPTSHLLDALVDILYDQYFGDEELVSKNKEFEKLLREKLKMLIEEQDMIDLLVDGHEDYLYEIFRDEALDYYES